MLGRLPAVNQLECRRIVAFLLESLAVASIAGTGLAVWGLRERRTATVQQPVAADRAGMDGPSLEACVHVFRATSEVSAQGRYVLTPHTRVTLRFVDILLVQLRSFDGQNSLSDLDIVVVDPAENDGRRFSVCFGSNVGVEGELLCNRIVVRAVEPFDPLGSSDDPRDLA
jgi:hypothetical protein